MRWVQVKQERISLLPCSELVDEIMNHNLTQVPHNATSADLPPSSEPVVHDSSGLGLPTVPSSVTATQSNVDSAALHSACLRPLIWLRLRLHALLYCWIALVLLLRMHVIITDLIFNVQIQLLIVAYIRK